VLEDAEGLAELRRLGARSVPVLSRGDDFVFAQNLRQVAEFLGLHETAGPALTHESLTASPPEAMRTTATIAAYGAEVRCRLAAWWRAQPDKSGKAIVQTYYGPQMLHEYLERTTWHVGQHVRQWMMLLRMAGIEPDQPVMDDKFAGLPMPSAVWDG
jgi:hypothetical protein